MKTSSGPILKADPTLRKKAVLLVILLGLLGFMGFLKLDELLQAIFVLAEKSPKTALQQMALVFGMIIAVMALLLLIFAGWLTHFCFQVLQTKQLPPPGTSVIRDTRIVFGASALWRARLGLLVAAVIAGCAFCTVWISSQIYHQMREQIADLESQEAGLGNPEIEE